MPPVIALFLKAPRPGYVKTRLAASLGPHRATQVYRHLVARQVRALPAGLAVSIHFDPPDAEATLRTWLDPLFTQPPAYHAQCAGDLGARLTFAFAREFSRGARGVLAIGGDCPALDVSLLRAAALALAEADAVLGPATDGGYYLLGLRAPNQELFAGIDWGTAAVLAQTRSRLHTAALRTHELPPLDDLDNETDFHRAVAAGLLPAFPDSTAGESVASAATSPPSTSAPRGPLSGD